MFFSCPRLVSRHGVLYVASRPGFSRCTSFDRVIITPHCVIDISHEFYWNDFAPTFSIKSVNTGKSVKQILDEIKCAKRKKADETTVERFMKGKEKGRGIAMVSFSVRQVFQDFSRKR